MYHFKSIIALGLALIFGFYVSCVKNNIEPQPENWEYDYTPDYSYFPMELGTTWEYAALYDNNILCNYIDAIIERHEKQEGDSVIIAEYLNNDTMGYNYSAYWKNGGLYFHHLDAEPNRILDAPVELGRKWEVYNLSTDYIINYMEAAYAAVDSPYVYANNQYDAVYVRNILYDRGMDDQFISQDTLWIAFVRDIGQVYWYMNGLEYRLVNFIRGEGN